MCLACGMSCCALDTFVGCGCDDCQDIRCVTTCDFCGGRIGYCNCDDGEDWSDYEDEPVTMEAPL
jgi:hypothetical protein